MVNIDKLPKTIEYNGYWYDLHLTITAWGKICVSYALSGGPKEALRLKLNYQILSQVVEPDMNYPSNYSDDITDIVDVPNSILAFNVLGTRVNQALSKNLVKIITHKN